MAGNVTVDRREFDLGIKRLEMTHRTKVDNGIRDIAEETLRLSSYEVPHDTGMLQTSGHVERAGEAYFITGYNKVYAARLHEHPEYRFQKGRKGKYLEDPVKHNLSVFRKYIEEIMKNL